jgi:hypothetical protein
MERRGHRTIIVTTLCWRRVNLRSSSVLHVVEWLGLENGTTNMISALAYIELRTTILYRY